MQLDLDDAARRHYPDAEIHYRRVTLTGNSREAGAISFTRAHPPDNLSMANDRPVPAYGVDELVTPKRRRLGVDQIYGSLIHVANDEPDHLPDHLTSSARMAWLFTKAVRKRRTF